MYPCGSSVFLCHKKIPFSVSVALVIKISFGDQMAGVDFGRNSG